MWPGAGEGLNRQASTGGYHAKGEGSTKHPGGKRAAGARAGFTFKVNFKDDFDFPVGEFRFVGASRISKKEIILALADYLG